MSVHVIRRIDTALQRHSTAFQMLIQVQNATILTTIEATSFSAENEVVRIVREIIRNALIMRDFYLLQHLEYCRGKVVLSVDSRF